MPPAGLPGTMLPPLHATTGRAGSGVGVAAIADDQSAAPRATVANGARAHFVLTKSSITVAQTDVGLGRGHLIHPTDCNASHATNNTDSVILGGLQHGSQQATT